MSGSVTANEGTIGGFTLGSTSLIAGSGTTRVAIDTAAGIHLGNNTFSSAPFRVTRAGALTATSVAITGEVNASSGTTATSLTAIGVATGSLNTTSGSMLMCCADVSPMVVVFPKKDAVELPVTTKNPLSFISV